MQLLRLKYISTMLLDMLSAGVCKPADPGTELRVFLAIDWLYHPRAEMKKAVDGSSSAKISSSVH